MATAVFFDAFGTLVWRQDGLNPHRQLLRDGVKQGRKPKADDARRIMTLDCEMPELAITLGIELTAERRHELQGLIDADIAAIKPDPDAQAAIQVLQQHGVAIAVCSNLAQPYGKAVRSFFPHLDAYGYSYELGILKPDAEIYAWIRQALGLSQDGEVGDQLWMIGDSLRCDRNGARAVGFLGYHLHREGRGEFSDLLHFAHHVLSSTSA